MKHAGLLPLLLAVLGALPASSEEVLTPEHFHYGRKLEVQGPGPLHTVLLDLDVYQGSVQPELADLRVFNGAGEVVPHSLRALADGFHAVEQPEGDLRPLPLFALPAASLTQGDAAEGTYSIDAELSSEGAIVRVLPGAETRDAQPGGYLLDASQLGRGVVGLELEIGPEPAEFMVPLRVEGSDDLDHWETLTPRAVVARLFQAGHRIEIRQIELPFSARHYLRIRWPETQFPARIEAVHARLAAQTAPAARERARIPGMAQVAEPDAFLFDLAGEIPVDRVQLDLPHANTLVEAELYSSASPQGPWTRHFSGLLYELDEPDALRGPEIPWPVTRQRYAKLLASSKGGGLGAGIPVLEISWLPEQLLFVARGAPPFTLAYGRAGVPRGSFVAAELTAVARATEREVPRESARLGPQHTLNDFPVLELPPAPRAIPWRSLALWGVLLAAVAAVLAMSLHLLRQLRSSKP